MPSDPAASLVPLSLTRDDGLQRLTAFAPDTDRYHETRNYDLGPSDRSTTSVLSPWISTRLVRESEAVNAALDRHPFSHVEKWIQEVCWRTYWKGWLEMRPQVWADYRNDLAEMADESTPPEMRAATTGTTGIDCFDAWCSELVETGYLHNHARMWFASIWIFTLRLPWQLGASFFLRHLADADAASNTLSWRWVAGLHTKGKHYLARAENITKFTGGRFGAVRGLNESASPLVETREATLQPLKKDRPTPNAGRIGLLLHGDDCSAERIVRAPVSTVAAIFPRIPLSQVWSAANLQRRESALKDALSRAAERFQCPPQSPADPAAWAADERLDAVVMARLPTGVWRDAMQPLLSAMPCPVVECTDPWDAALWPQATHGYFRFKSQLPALAARWGRRSDQQ